MSARFRYVGTFVAAAVLLVGCGQQSGSVAVRRGDEDPTSSISLVPEFGTGPSAANDDWLVGVTTDPHLSTRPSVVSEVDLRSGKTKMIPGPSASGIPVSVEALVPTADGFWGAGNRCDPPDGGEGCGGRNVLVKLDPASGAWQVEEISLEPNGVLDSLHVVGSDLVRLSTTDQTLAVLRRDQGGNWSTVASLTTPERPESCVGAGDLWLFRRHAPTNDNVAAKDTDYSLTRLDLHGGKATDVELPRLARSFGGATTSFGCDASGPVIATTPAGDVPPANADPDEMKRALTGVDVWHLGVHGWGRVAVGEFGSGTVTDSIVSGERALIVGAELVTSGENKPIAAVIGGGRSQEVPRDGTDTYLWRNRRELLRIFGQGAGRQVETVKVGS